MDTQTGFVTRAWTMLCAGWKSTFALVMTIASIVGLMILGRRLVGKSQTKADVKKAEAQATVLEQIATETRKIEQLEKEADEAAGRADWHEEKAEELEDRIQAARKRAAELRRKTGRPG